MSKTNILDINAILAQAFVKSGKTQRKVAEEANITERALRSILKGQSTPKPENVTRIAAAVGLEVKHSVVIRQRNRKTA